MNFLWGVLIKPHEHSQVRVSPPSPSDGICLQQIEKISVFCTGFVEYSHVVLLPYDWSEQKRKCRMLSSACSAKRSYLDHFVFESWQANNKTNTSLHYGRFQLLFCFPWELWSSHSQLPMYLVMSVMQFKITTFSKLIFPPLKLLNKLALRFSWSARLFLFHQYLSPGMFETKVVLRNFVRSI